MVVKILPSALGSIFGSFDQDTKSQVFRRFQTCMFWVKWYNFIGENFIPQNLCNPRYFPWKLQISGVLEPQCYYMMLMDSLHIQVFS